LLSYFVLFFFFFLFFFFQAEDGIRDFHVTGVQTCALPICFFISERSEDMASREDEFLSLVFGNKKPTTTTKPATQSSPVPAPPVATAPRPSTSSPSPVSVQTTIPTSTVPTPPRSQSAPNHAQLNEMRNQVAKTGQISDYYKNLFGADFNPNTSVPTPNQAQARQMAQQVQQ